LLATTVYVALWAALEGEEHDHFAAIITRLVVTWQVKPATYATSKPQKCGADAGEPDSDYSAGNPAEGEAPKKA